MDLQEAIYRLIKDKFITQTFTGKVKTVDKTKDSCMVESFDEGPDLFDVRLTSCIEDKETKILTYPKEGSTVLVGIVNGDESDAFILSYGEIEEAVIKCDKITINDGTNGGLININDLKTELAKYTALLNAMKNVFSAWVPAAGDGGAALKAAMNAAIASLNLPDFSGIEDTKVKH